MPSARWGLFNLAMSQLHRILPLLAALVATAQAETAGLVANIDLAKCEALREGAAAAGVTFGSDSPDFTALPGLLVWQADDRGRHLSDKDVAALEKHLAAGHSLLVTLAPWPGNEAFRLAPVLPTTAWQTLLPYAHRGAAAPAVDAGEADAAFFRAPPRFTVPHRWRIRPQHIAEMGETRYEQLDHALPYLNYPLPAGTPYLSRSLLNRDAEIRLASADESRDGLLLTGRYGAGRVAVFASGAESGTAAFWQDVFAYLALSEPQPYRIPPDPVLSFRLDKAKRRLIVSGTTTADSPPASLPVVARLSTWDGATFDDLSGILSLPARGGSEELALDLPAPGPTGVQALEKHDFLRVRVGVLSPVGSPSGNRIVREETLVLDARPGTFVELLAPELDTDAVPNPLPGPEPFMLKQNERGGAFVGNYSFRPGAEYAFTLRARRNRVNLAPLATCTIPDAKDPAVGHILNDFACNQMRPRETIHETGFLEGPENGDWTIRFDFHAPVALDAIALLGTWNREAHKNVNFPGAVRVTADGREVLSRDGLEALVNPAHARVTLDFPEASGTVWTVVFPWIERAPNGFAHIRSALGEIELYGRAGDKARLPDRVTLRAVPFGGSVRTLATADLPSVADGGEAMVSVPLRMPALAKGETLGFGRIEAVDGSGAVLSSVPYLLSEGKDGTYVESKTALKAPGNTIDLVHCVTRGFRHWVPDGAGTRDAPGAWGSPEDIVFGYSRRLKQASPNAAPDAAKLFLSEHAFTHYCNPWGVYPDGERFFAAHADDLVSRLKRRGDWAAAANIHFGFGDRWDTGPALNAMYSWQELVEFDRHLRRNGGEGLKGRTHRDLKKEVNDRYLHPFMAWQLERYLANFRTIRAIAEDNGKTMLHSGQGMPLLPPAAATEIGQVLRGMSDDNTWGCFDEDFPLTAARQMTIKAFNPGWKIGSNLVWGWDNCVFNNAHWWMPVGVTESSRRHLATRAWRGAILDDGTYTSMHSYGYGMNGYSPACANENDWTQGWQAAERQNRFLPDGPLGLGCVVGTGVLTDPGRTLFSGGGMGGDNRLVDQLQQRTYRAIGPLHHRRVPIPFAANASAIANARFAVPTPLVAPQPATFSAAERSFLADAARSGTNPLVLFTDGEPLAPEFADLFADARPIPDDARIRVNDFGIVVDARHEDLGTAGFDALARLILADLPLPLVLPDGTNGYGFTMGRRLFAAVEDVREKARTVEVRFKAAKAAAKATAMELNEHTDLAVRRDGADWVVTLPLRRGDGVLVALEETR